ncbi:MAG: CAP domain-containing protein [Anaerolineae bacterium]|nr:CAP domain-containing protein [Anaerolineae bacterium]
MSVTAQPESNANEARALVAALNAWRIDLGLSPLSPNPILERMALDQAQYILEQPQIPSGAAIHTGRNGEDPRARALYPRYNWPVYGQPEQLVLSEIASARPNVQGAINFWRGSDVHNRTVSNGWYREVGVAVLPYRLGFVYLVVLGSQPNVLPALADVRSGTLYLSNETYPRGRGDWIRNADQIRLFDSQGRPLADWQPWAATVMLPQTSGDSLYVVYKAGTAEAVRQVSLRPQDILLPQYADAWQGSVAVASVPTSAPTLRATSAAMLATNTPEANPTLALVPTSTTAPIIAGATATTVPTTSSGSSSAPSGPTVTLIYTPSTLTILADRAGLNLSGLVLTNGTTSIRVAALQAQYIRGTIQSFGARDCLFVTIDRAITSPTASCGFTSTTFYEASRAVWRNDFRVERNGEVAATCRATEGRCVVPMS